MCELSCTRSGWYWSVRRLGTRSNVQTLFARAILEWPSSELWAPGTKCHFPTANVLYPASRRIGSKSSRVRCNTTAVIRITV